MPHSVHSDEPTPLGAIDRIISTPSPISELTCDPSLLAPIPRLSNRVNVARLFPPFEGCNLILRATKTRPHVEFYVDRETVYNRSPYLKRKIFELGPIPAGIEIIAWEDDADTLDSMLRFIYCDRPKPQVESVAHLRFLLKAARKYDIEAARHALGTSVLLDFATKEPLPAFAIACEFGLVDEATLISKDTLKVDIMMDGKSSELDRVSLSYYHRLLRLHRVRKTRAIDILSLIDPAHPMDEPNPPYCEECGANAIWWQIFVQYGSIELKRRPVTDTIFSPAFLAKCVRTSSHVCGGCVDSYMHTYSQKLLTRLKEDIDQLPAYISLVDPFVAK
ncbi:unnamed protein product [Rhizoctonia solani]|uniref:BTB domain-containing protein n=1 Tax=Rhizoctonia solani TaxID=456999 RepID=A0A8H2X139_9AGAM|nr:unnamed protein product [Rhizoctonia solani]